ncbi:DUF3164 domain-containing protein [Paramuribaculum intestinale]|jgi:hypothetical protein|uniref:DUF3164 domain-containing protein n=1 Tax=Paramuribaculum intestinale TaxID=2094151 RepID=A0A2V1J0X5_9BACT|nr:DUF3164 family protein [Paramuribaculum intestinale]PWB08345.1 DUF3164 domain-containing protein [Paramuribaculum intestinale]DAS70599.1 MAG TPA: Protein of unknown function (DUF3164) [Caudoviricetes sp.]
MENVTMTADERREFEAYRAEKQKKEAAERRKQQRTDYAAMVDDEVRTTLPVLRELSEQIKTVKSTVFGNFDAILRMKSEVLGLTKDDQRSHTFTTSDSKFRLTLGVNTVDGYRDTVEDGIAMVKGYIQSLAKDETSKALVNAVLRLLSRDGQGNIKASRVLQLRKMAEETGDERFIEGVQIIEESYQPTETKKYIRAEYKNDKGAWVNIPLGMTDVE